jgi:GT2 family glycosyltransferase/glycosyltransferase involved in cell wall biosynthesis
MTEFAAVSSNIAAITAEAFDAMFWQPSRLGVESAWYGHVPFAHWLVAAFRPSSIVELGAHNGVSYAAFCEAVVRCNLGARALAVDTWQGDEHAGFYDDAVYTDLRAFHDRRYAAFSTLLRSTFDNALQFVPDGSVDLLHIDGRHRYEDVAHDFRSWLPKMSRRGVVLFHDTNVHAGDFGVWRLWAELRAAYDGHFEFLHGHGLGVLQVGAPGGDLEDLFTLTDSTAVNRIRDRFAALGERWIEISEADRMRADLQRTTRDLEATRIWAENAQNEVNRLYPLYQHLNERTRSVRSELAQARFDLSAYELRLQEQCARRAQAELQIASLQQNRIALEERQASLEHSLALYRHQSDALLASTSWRITGPLRRASRLGRRPPALLHVAPTALPPPAAPAITEVDRQTSQTTPMNIGTHRPRALFLSGEDHTPGHVYRVERYVDAATRAGFDARAMSVGPVGPADLDGVDIVVLWRVAFSTHVQGIITVVHEQGGLVIFDVDDLMFRPELAVVKFIDGIRSQNFNELDTQALFHKIADTLRASDLVTCPTAELAHEARGLGKPAYVLPNGFDKASHDVARAARRDWVQSADDLLRIGYAGGSRTHQRDFAVAVPAIIRLLGELPDLRLSVFRDPSSGEGLVLLNEFPELAAFDDRIEWRDMVPLADLPKEIARFSVNIAPLEPGNPFCEAKSELKFFEAALAGVPTVASPTGPFARAIRHGETGFLAEGDEAWYQALRSLLQDAALRSRVAQAAYHVCLGAYGPEARAESFSLMVAQMRGGEAGAAAFEREMYRAGCHSARVPHVPESETVFSIDRRGEAAVTVIVPLYNYADYVPEALASVVAQTLQKLDLVVVEDCSTDDSHEMVLAWAQLNAGRFNRLRIVRHKVNSGLGFARNTGFALAETEFVLPLDADNRLRPGACETLLAALSASSAAFAYPQIQQFGDRTEVLGKLPYSILRLQAGNYIDAMALVRKSAWASIGGYDHVQFGWEDFDFWCRLAEHGRYGISVPEVLADYRAHDKSMLHLSTDVRENRARLAADMRRRHPWLDVA